MLPGSLLVARHALCLRMQLCVGGSHEEQLAPMLRINFKS